MRGEKKLAKLSSRSATPNDARNSPLYRFDNSSSEFNKEDKKTLIYGSLLSMRTVEDGSILDTLRYPKRGGNEQRLAAEDPVVMRTIDDIYREAQSHFTGTTSKLKEHKDKKYLGRLDRRLRKLGIPRIISPDVVNEIKNEQSLLEMTLHHSKSGRLSPFSKTTDLKSKTYGTLNTDGLWRPNTAPAQLQENVTKSLGNNTYLFPPFHPSNTTTLALAIANSPAFQQQSARKFSFQQSSSSQKPSTRRGSVESTLSVTERSSSSPNSTLSPSDLNSIPPSLSRQASGLRKSVRNMVPRERRQSNFRAMDEEASAKDQASQNAAKDALFEDKDKEHPLALKYQQNELQMRRAWLVAVQQVLFLKSLAEEIASAKQRRLETLRQLRVLLTINLIQRWWRSGRIRSTFRHRPWLAVSFLQLYLIWWRKREVARRRLAGNLIAKFFGDVRNMGEKILALHTFRMKVLKVQRWCREFIQCQRARLQLLWLAFEKIEKEIHLEQASTRNKLENASKRHLMLTKNFGQTVSRIERVNGQVNQLFMKYKRMQLKSEPIQGRNWKERLQHTKIGAKKLQILQNFLRMQRRRHIVEKSYTQKYAEVPKVTSVGLLDVKQYLADPGYKNVAVSFSSQPNQKSKMNSFLLFNGGSAMEDLRSIALALSKDRSYAPDLESMGDSYDA